MNIIDSLAARNKYYILACSYGRSVWMREIGGDDPTAINNNNSGIPKKFALYQNYPNPFNASSNIKFDIPSNVKRQMSNVKIIIYDILGRRVETLVNEELKPGTYEISWDANNYPSGVYIYMLSAGDFSDTKKMILLK